MNLVGGQRVAHLFRRHVCF